MRGFYPIVAILLLGIAGCGGQPPKPVGPPQITSTDFDPHIMLVGDKVFQSLNLAGGADVRMRTIMDRATRTPLHQVYIDLFYGGSGWQFFSIATNSSRVPLKVVSIARDVESCGPYGCTYDETFAVEVREADLRNAGNEGYRIQVRAKGGAVEMFTVTPAQIRFQLDASDRLRGK